MTDVVTASDGAQLDLSSLPQVLGYTGANLTTITVVASNQFGVIKTYIQTLTYTGSNLTGISRWTVQ